MNSNPIPSEASYARWLAWPLVGLYLVLVAAGFLFQLLNQRSFNESGYASAIGLSVAIGIASVIAVLIVRRFPHNPIGWVLLFVSLAWGAELLSDGYAFYGLVSYPGSLPGAEIVVIWQSAHFSRFVLVALTLLFLWFPGGRPLSSRWGTLAWIASGAAFAHAMIAALRPGPLLGYRPYVNPIGIDEKAWSLLNPILVPANLVLALCLWGAAVSLIIRLRVASGDERQQIKWFMYAAALFPSAFIVVEFGGPELLPVGLALQFLTITGMVFAIAISIFKYRLYDIDVIINRTLVYGALSGALAIVYLLSVLVLQNLISSVTGQQSPLAIVVSTLLVVAVFHPLRRRIQGFIDRRFYRRKYRADQLLARFGLTLRDEVEFEEVAGSLLEVVNQSVQPKHLSLWLRARQRTHKRHLEFRSTHDVNDRRHRQQIN